jgi:hypothetical protein
MGLEPLPPPAEHPVTESIVASVATSMDFVDMGESLLNQGREAVLASAT